MRDKYFVISYISLVDSIRVIDVSSISRREHDSHNPLPSEYTVSQRLSCILHANSHDENTISLLYFSVGHDLKISIDKIVVTGYKSKRFDLKYSTVSRGKIYIYIYVRVREKVKGSKVSQGTVPRFDHVLFHQFSRA